MVGYRRELYRSGKDVCHDTLGSDTQCVMAHLAGGSFCNLGILKKYQTPVK